MPFYYGKDKGYYAAEGIDLTINEGRGSANTVQVVAAGSDTFGLADSSSVILTASKGADIKSVMSLLNTTGFSVVSLAESGIKTPKDLEGKTVAVTPGDPLGQLLQAVCKANSVDCAKIGMVQVDPAAKVVMVLEKKADALLGGADDQYFLIKYKGANPAAMRYADWGANIVGMTILTSGETIKKNPDLVRDRARRVSRGKRKVIQAPRGCATQAKPVNRHRRSKSSFSTRLFESKNAKGIGGSAGILDQTSPSWNYRPARDKAGRRSHKRFLPK